MIATARRTLALSRVGLMAGRPHALAALAVAVLFAAAPVAAAPVLVDSFTTNQATVTDPPGGSNTATTAGTDIIGTRRGLVVDLSTGVGPMSAGVSGGVLTFSVTNTTPDSRGTATVTWDGDLTPLVLSPTGLGGVDLTGGGTNSGLAIDLTAVTGTVELVVTIYTDGSNASRGGARVTATGTRVLPFSQLAVFAGSGADLTDVGAIVLEVVGTESSASITQVQAITPAVAAIKVDLDTSNVPLGSTTVIPGDTIRYRVTITNPGGEATAVNISDVIDTNVELPGAEDVLATPVAQPRQYIGFGNVTLDVGVAADGLLKGARDPDQGGSNPTLQLAGSQTTSAQGGTINYGGMTDGTFDYVPPPGYRGVDSFNFTVVDNDGQTTLQTATIVLGERVWFVDDSAAPGGNGTQALPFDAIADVNNASDPDDVGDTIFFFSGSYDAAAAGGFALEASQKIRGQGVALVLGGQTIVAAGGAPTLTNSTASANGLALSSDNTLQGFTVGNTTGVDIAGSNFGTLTVSDVTLNGTGGALDLDNGALAATFTGVTSTSSATAIDLDTVTGTLNTGGTTISGATVRGIRVINGGSTYSFGATSVNAADGILLTTNATSTFNFTSLGVTTSAGAGLTATTSGTLNIGGTTNAINATGGAALDVTSTSLGSGATFSTVSSSGSTGKGINLDTVSGPLTMNGGSITTAAGIDFDVSGGSANITYAGSITNAANRSVEITGRTGGTVTLSGTISDTGTGINVANNSASGSPVINFSGSSKVINTGANAAITLDNNDVATINFTGGALDIDTTSGTGFNAINGAAAITVQGSTNTLTATSGIALNMASSAIGALGLTFESINAGTGAGTAGVGISLSGTGVAAGNGGLTVTGTGSAGSGGTIRNKTGSDGSTTGGIGIYLNQTKAASFSWMQLNDFQNFAIRGNEIVGLTLSNVVISGLNGNNASFDDGSIYLDDAGGTVAISSSNVGGGFQDNLFVVYDGATAGPAATFNVTGTTFRDLQSAGQNAQVNLNSTTAASSSWDVDFNFTSSCVFENDANTLPPGGTENFSDGILVTFEGPFPHLLNVRNSTFHHLFQGMDIASNFSADVTYQIKDNAITFTEGVAAIALGSGSSSTAGSFLTGVIQGNNIGTSGVAQSGNRLGLGIALDMRGEEIAQFTVHANNIRRTEVNGIQVIGQTAADGNLDIQITNNLIEQIEDDGGGGAGVIYGLEVTTNAATSHDICLDIRSNDSFNINAQDIRVRQSNAAVTFAIEDLTGSGASDTNVENYIISQNPGNTADVRTGGSIVSYTSVPDCTTPATL